MRAGSGIILSVLLAACVSNPPVAPQIQRISPEELERIMPKPVATLTLDDIVGLTKNGTSPDQIIAKIEAREALNKSHMAAHSALRDGMQGRRRHKWLFPLLGA